MRLALALSLASASALLVPLFASFSACTSAAPASDGGEDLTPLHEDAFDDSPAFCNASVVNGKSCSPIAPDKVFCAMCEAGGCYCVFDPKTKSGVWKCTVDDSCIPTCAPDSDACALDGGSFVDTGPIPDSFVLPDAGVDATVDAAPDATPKDAGAFDANAG